MTGLEYHRRIQGVSISALSVSSGISKITIMKMERDPENVTRDTAIKIADALGVSVDQLLEIHAEEETVHFSLRTSVQSATSNPDNCLERYRREKHITFQTLAKRCGNTTKEAGRIACRRDSPLLKHIQAVADFEGISVEEFNKKYGG